MAMIRGLRTVSYPAPDLALGKAWYGKVLEKEPYFDEPFYVGYNVGGFELGLVPDAKPGPDGPIGFWAVDDCAAALQRLIDLGAPVVAPVTDVGGGIKVATVLDPFGNTFGIIENPHFNRAEVE